MCKRVKDLAPNLGDKKVNKRVVMSCHVVHFVICLHHGNPRHPLQKHSVPGHADQAKGESQRHQDEEGQQEVFLGCEGVSEDCSNIW